MWEANVLANAIKFESTEAFAKELDAADELAHYRDQFFIPTRESLEGGDTLTGLPRQPEGEKCIYLAGNSLGLEPKRVQEYILEELEDWARLGVEGHFNGRHPWLPYHEFVADMSSRLVGAKPAEVVVMNTLTVNLHLMMVSFYRPEDKRFKILIRLGRTFKAFLQAGKNNLRGFSPNRPAPRN